MPSVNVNFVRPELLRKRREYTTVYDALAGEPMVKSKGELYLPAAQPIVCDATRHRYHAYRTRAVFYNVTKRTQQGLLGQVFSRPPEINVPEFLRHTVANMDGLGVSATQSAKGTAGEVIAYGRAGLLADFPTLENGQEATAADLQSGRVAATITRYEAHQIINWRYYRDYTSKKLLFVILEEKREVYRPGEFSFTRQKQWRVLRLDDSGYYVQELYQDQNAEPIRSFPTDYSGDRLNFIPFFFIGSENNDPDIDEAPLYSIAAINIAHYRNSADFEDSTFFVGQPTIAITGLNQGWLDQNLKGELRMGSREAIPLPVGADIKLVQAEGNNLAKEGMLLKEAEMLALGAKLVEANQRRPKTATEAAQEEAAELSVLQTIADNESQAYTDAFTACGRFYTGQQFKPVFKLNTAFEIATLDAPTRAETVKEWQMGALTFEEMRQVLRRGGIATLPDDVAKNKIAEENAVSAAAAAAAMGAPNLQDPTNGNAA